MTKRFLVVAACWLEAETADDATGITAAALRLVRDPQRKGAVVNLAFPQAGLREGLDRFDLADVLDPKR